jgi:multidrug efflux pump subunit AcrA (membrane-fusion protein)
MKLRTVLLLLSVLAVIGALAWGAIRIVRATTATTALELPTTRVKHGRVTLTVACRGELQGGNSEMLTAPMISGSDMAITSLRDPGELVSPGDVVVQFDTTEQEFKLKEAEADLAEAQQQIVKAEADSLATDEESQYAMLSAQSDVQLAEIELRRNPTLARIAARQNEILLEAARNRLRQATQDLANKKTTSSAGIAIQKALENKARVMADLARKNIENMTLKAKTGGYVNVQQNSNQNMMYWGMQLPPFQLGDTARSGMAVAQIPDLHSWEFAGQVKNIGGTTGPPWDRRFEARISLLQAAPELRPGMTSNLVITVETLDNVLWIPAQALFESDGRTFVYTRGPSGFVPHDVALVRRSESQAVITGIREGEIVAMSNPDQQLKSGATQSGSAMKALSQ